GAHLENAPDCGRSPSAACRPAEADCKNSVLLRLAKRCQPGRFAPVGGSAKQLKRVPRVEGGSNACEFDTPRRENAYFRSRSHTRKFKSVTWKMRPIVGMAAKAGAQPIPLAYRAL